ncbi:MAG: 4a-hydroxytetrahydrobiopterin dehydratase [Ilumatobacteraceae bacterium]
MWPSASHGSGRDHLPDMAISWNKVTLRLTTQRTGHMITELDRRLAARVDTLAAQ